MPGEMSRPTFVNKPESSGMKSGCLLALPVGCSMGLTGKNRNQWFQISLCKDQTERTRVL